MAQFTKKDLKAMVKRNKEGQDKLSRELEALQAKPKAASRAQQYGRCRGRVVKSFEVVPGTGVVRRYRFELRRDALYVGRVGTRRKTWRVISLATLANLARPQPELFVTELSTVKKHNI